MYTWRVTIFLPLEVYFEGGVQSSDNFFLYVAPLKKFQSENVLAILGVYI